MKYITSNCTIHRASGGSKVSTQTDDLPLRKRQLFYFGLALLVLFALTNSGCFLFNFRSRSSPIVKENKLTAQAPAGKKKPPGALELLIGSGALPQGFYYLFQRRRSRRRTYRINGRRFYRVQARAPSALYALPNYPKPGQAHAVLAVYKWGFPRRYRGSRTDIPDEVRKQASRLGANTLFRLTPRAKVCYALYVSDALPKENLLSARELLQAQSKKNAAYAASGSRVQKHNIEQSVPIVVSTQASRCYRLAFALGPRSFWDDKALTGIVTVIASRDPWIRQRRIVVTEVHPTPSGFLIRAPFHGKYARMRSFSIQLGCTRNAGRISIRLESQSQSALGRGTFFTQVLSKKMTSKERQSIVDADRSTQPPQTYAPQTQPPSPSNRRVRAYRRRRSLPRRRSKNFLSQERNIANEEQRELERERQRELERERSLRSRHRVYRSQAYRLMLRNRCNRSVRLYISRNPRLRSGARLFLGRGKSAFRAGFAPQTLWLVHPSGRPLSRYLIQPGYQTILIHRSCRSLLRR